MTGAGRTELSPQVRDRLRSFSDSLIPAAHGMPAASEIGVAEAQLDKVIQARSDLLEPMLRALDQIDPAAAEQSLSRVQASDPEAHEALLMAIVGAYYTHPEVRKRLAYDGQQPVEVRPEIIPNYVEEGLIDPVLERGPIYRTIPEQEETA